MSKKLFVALLLVTAVILLGAGVWGRRAFRHIAQERQLTLAEAFLREGRGNYRSATLAARQVLTRDPNNVRALTLMAELTEKVGSPECLLWKQRLVDLEPGNAARLEDLAQTAVRFRDPFAAEQALAQVRESDRNTASYHEAKAASALSAKDYSRALLHFEKASALAPANELLRFNVAAIQLQSSDPATVSRARATLEQQRTVPGYELVALRALLSDARRGGDTARARQLADELERRPNATLEDHLLYLEELHHANDPRFAEALTAVGVKAAGTAEEAFRFMMWLDRLGMTTRAIEWGEALPEKIRTQIPVPMALAEAYAGMGDWKTLGERLANADWGTMDFLRLGFQAKVLEAGGEARNNFVFQNKWDRAVVATGGNSQAMMMLAHLAQVWKWDDEAAKVWWLQAGQKAGQRPALTRLYNLYTARRNTPKLLAVARRIQEVEPSNLGAANNAAYFALLTGVDLPQAYALAEKLYKQMPGQPVFASTYALALHRQKRDAEAVKVLEMLPENFLRQPAVASCYGAVLAASGANDKAKSFLEIAVTNRNALLPEEADLAEEGMRSVVK